MNTSQLLGGVSAAAPTDEQVDKAIYDIDAVMNGYAGNTLLDVPPFMAEHLASMRAIIRRLYARPPI